MMIHIEDKINRTLFELECGIITFGIMCEAAILIVSAFKRIDLAYLSAGLLAGILTAVLYAYHMWWGIDRALLFPQDVATKKLKLYYIIRYVALIVVLAIICISGRISCIMTFIGFMGVKTGAYLNRPMKLISNKIYGIEPVYTGEEAINNQEAAV